MIRATDAAVLAYTKLRTHRMRTGLTVGLAGILFGLIMAAIFIVQGVFDSVARFSNEGLNNRTILALSHSSGGGFDFYEHTTDKQFIAEVEAKREASVAKKTAAAKKYGIEYNPDTEDPSPVRIDPKTRERSIADDGLGNTYVQAAVDARQAENEAFDIHNFLKPYKTAHVIEGNAIIMPKDGALTYMKDGVEPGLAPDKKAPNRSDDVAGVNNGSNYMTLLNGSLTKPFVINTVYDPQKGELPIILPYADAERLLGLKKLDKSASNQAKLDRLGEVRRRISEVTVSYCYRNAASMQLLETALAQAEEMKRSKGTADYIAPPLQYEVPRADSCGLVKIIKDTRTPDEKQQIANRTAYEKEIGTYLGEPSQSKVILRGVGITSDYDSHSLSSTGELVNMLLGSNLGYGAWVIPADLLHSVPKQHRPDGVFGAASLEAAKRNMNDYIVEFDDKEEARALLGKTSMGGGEVSGGVFVMPFGSNILIIDELKTGFAKFMFWALIIVGGVAAVILGGIIGRTVSEGRRESAVFRAIGAKRTDIAGIYGVYAFLLSFRVVLFAAVLGGVIALTIELLYWRDATVAARLAYAASDTSLEFHLFGVASLYILFIVGAIIVVSLLGAVVPIVRNARRNPINDMRDE